MGTKLYKDHMEQTYLVFEMTKESHYTELQKFLGGSSEVRILKDQEVVVLEADLAIFPGDYIVYVIRNDPFSNVRLFLDDIVHRVPQQSYLKLSSEEFERNFKEV